LEENCERPSTLVSIVADTIILEDPDPILTLIGRYYEQIKKKEIVKHCLIIEQPIKLRNKTYAVKIEYT
jgi:hypothetical protein